VSSGILSIVSFAYLFFALLFASATLGGAIMDIGIVFAQPLLKNGPKNAQRHQAKQ
jgi:hypothetical protein